MDSNRKTLIIEKKNGIRDSLWQCGRLRVCWGAGTRNYRRKKEIATVAIAIVNLNPEPSQPRSPLTMLFNEHC